MVLEWALAPVETSPTQISMHPSGSHLDIIHGTRGPAVSVRAAASCRRGRAAPLSVGYSNRRNERTTDTECALVCKCMLSVRWQERNRNWVDEAFAVYSRTRPTQSRPQYIALEGEKGLATGSRILPVEAFPPTTVSWSRTLASRGAIPSPGEAMPHATRCIPNRHILRLASIDQIKGANIDP